MTKINITFCIPSNKIVYSHCCIYNLHLVSRLCLGMCHKIANLFFHTPKVLSIVHLKLE
ncbi:hypothetical protein Fmac_015950 [Flemingia macrophylla]|uniref:Uncharacterized protein n=1 Tax=Flemingia macrophylla TaxID=520843 RepID=A0ABD1MG03_9FABA